MDNDNPDKSTKLNFAEIYSLSQNQSGDDDILPAIVNANVVISDVYLTIATKTFADENTSLTFNRGVAHFQDGTAKTYTINKLVSTTSVDYIIDFIVDTVENKVYSDKFVVGEASSGTIKITDIGADETTSTKLKTVAHNIANAYIADRSKDKVNSIVILERANSLDNITISVESGVFDDITEETTIKDNYYDPSSDSYIVNNESFVGKIGFAINSTLDAFLIGVIEEYDTLKQINIFKNDAETPTTRVFNLKNFASEYQSIDSAGTTSKGSLTINGNGGTINLRGFNGFILDSSDAYLSINNVSIKASAVALTTSYTVSEDEPEPNVIITDSIFAENTVSISNVTGVIKLINSVISESNENRLNQINNSCGATIIAQNTNFYSPIVNNGLIILDGTINIGKSSSDTVDYNVPISGNGTIQTTDDKKNIINLKYANITDPVNNTSNTLIFNNGTLYIGAASLAKANFIPKKGTIDLSGTIDAPGSETSELGYIDQPFNIYNYQYFDALDTSGNPLYSNAKGDGSMTYGTRGLDDEGHYVYTYVDSSGESHETTDESYKPVYSLGYIIDIDFSKLKADIITISDSNSKGVVCISKVNGEDTLRPSTSAGLVKIIDAPESVVLRLDGLGQRDYRFYVSYYYKDYDTGEIYDGYILQDDFFVGELHMYELEHYGIQIEKTPEYNAIIELNSAKHAEEQDYSLFPYFENI